MSSTADATTAAVPLVPVPVSTSAISASKKKPTQVISLLAGAIAGGMEATCVWPMEYIKTQLQLQERLPAGEKPKFTGMISGMRYTVQNHGFLALYRGLTPTLISAFPKAGIRFGSNAYFKKQLMDDQGKLTPGKNFLAGVGAGIIESIFVVTPVETVKTKLIHLNMSFFGGVKHIVAHEGMAGVYQGLGATIMKQGSNQGLRFMFFNEYKNWVTNNGQHNLTPLTSFLGGMSAGCFSTLCNNPLDVIKTRMQGLDAAKYKNALDCAQQLMRHEGAGVFLKGLIPRLGRVVPGQGIIFMSFETIQYKLVDILL
ncbi:hypothetical protein NSK_002979 [Nannochloropsis salina CCMP1776]|uniref:Mitochondrial carrier protein n=1 Tax=Nannochloropsis salina CCMP1776 TaxID=1027361 RepID=A0A4D9DA99_9STRA|nr:hypothetical protein NSK_002979 [Nannochloropsis salina CCMP1776]|eukprot:TFJ85469.1 hypothetical protein NSK_002979 [Nannochloropsis salina CCMP1776]